MILFDIVLPIDPPTVTHHAKELGMRYGKGKRLIPTMRDRPELEAAKGLIGAGLAQCRVRAGRRPRYPIAEPIILDVTFCFRAPQPAWWSRKPDRDNLCKTFTDVLVRNGWVEDDKLIVGGIVEKGCGPQPFIRAVAELADGAAWEAVYYAVRRRPQHDKEATPCQEAR